MNSAIIVSAGKGTRMKAEVSKQFLKLKDQPIISHTLKQFDDSPSIHEIILVINPLEEETIRERVLMTYSYQKPIKIVHGGRERQESVSNGLSAVNDATSIVLIHDGARPLVNHKIIQGCIEGVMKYGAVTVGVPVKDTIKVVSTDNFIKNTPKREELWITQTPQAFCLDIIKKAHELAKLKAFKATDDSMLVEQMGHKVKMVMGDYENIKITTPEDLVIAEGILSNRRFTENSTNQPYLD